MKIHVTTKLFGALIIACTLALSPITASAEQSTRTILSEKEEDQIREFWTKYDVPEQTQELLLAKYSETGSLDSFKESNPVATRAKTINGSVAQIEEFNDGSIRVTSVEIPSTNLGAYSQLITGCTNTSGSGYAIAKGCTIQTGDGVRYLNFKADWASYNGGNAEILRTYNPSAYGTGGSITSPKRSYWRPKSTKTQSARATYTSIWTGKDNRSSETMHATLWLTSRGVPSVGSS